MLVRMLGSMAKWDGGVSVTRSDGFLPGDTISDLRTQKNTLSTWEYIDENQELDDIAVALALNRQSAQKLVVVLLDPIELQKIDITHSSAMLGVSPGCPIDILKKHRDLVDLDYWRIGYLAEHILKLMKEKKNYRTYSEKKVRQLLESYRKANRIDLTKVKKELQKDMGWIPKE